MTITLYECKKLHAKISLASCEQNRHKIGGNKPIQCEKCTDYMFWDIDKGSKKVQELEVQKVKKLNTFVCPTCLRETKHHSKGLCQTCYQNAHRAKKMTKTMQKKSEPEVSFVKDDLTNLPKLPILSLLDMFVLYNYNVSLVKNEILRRSKD